jgi:hypothetical protein
VLTLLAAGCGGEEASDLRNESDTNPPAVAELVCGDDGPELSTPVVRAQKDGVHIRVRNETDHGVELDYEITRGATGGGGSVAPPGSSEHLIPFGAKEISVGCYAEALDRVDLLVVDPGGELKSAELQCAAYEPNPPVPPKSLKGGERVDVVRRFLSGRGLRPTDVVEQALPIADEFETVRVVRNGRVVAAVWFDDPDAVHGIGTVETCTDFAE